MKDVHAGEEGTFVAVCKHDTESCIHSLEIPHAVSVQATHARHLRSGVDNRVDMLPLPELFDSEETTWWEEANRQRLDVMQK